MQCDGNDALTRGGRDGGNFREIRLCQEKSGLPTRKRRTRDNRWRCLSDRESGQAIQFVSAQKGSRKERTCVVYCVWVCVCVFVCEIRTRETGKSSKEKNKSVNVI